MLWVVGVAVLALAGLAVLVAYGVWLAHKTADLLAEARVLAERGGRVAAALGEVRVPDPQPALSTLEALDQPPRRTMARSAGPPVAAPHADEEGRRP